MNAVIEEDFENIKGTFSSILKKMEGKSILITGACGMITSYLSELLIYLSNEYNLKVYLQCRNILKGKKFYGEWLDYENVVLLDFDFENNEMPECNPDYVIHAASPASTKAFYDTPVSVISPNMVGTWNILNWLKNKKVEKFLFFSSNSIYGEGGISKRTLCEEDYGIVNPLNDRACYIESKRIAELMCRAFWKQYGIPTSIIRICHTYGPTFDISNDSRIIPRVIKKIIEGRNVEIYRDPNSIIQYTYVADMITAILVVLVDGKAGEAYNAGSDELVKMDDAIKWMINADSRIKSKLIEKEIDNNYCFKKGQGINLIKVSSNKLQMLGWKTLYTNKQGFTRTVKKYMGEVFALENE